MPGVAVAQASVDVARGGRIGELLGLGGVWFTSELTSASRPRLRGGTSGPPAKAQGTSRLTVHLGRMTGYGLLMLALAGALALVWPAPLGQAGVPGAEVTRPPWDRFPRA